MREILFRGKRDNCEWVEGYYTQFVEFGDNGGVECYYREYEIVTDFIIEKNGTQHLINFKTIGQYVGIEDKNKTKVFEGDNIIIRDEQDEIWIVSWDNDESQWVLESENVCVALGAYNSYELEVVGNIHDGKEDESN